MVNLYQQAGQDFLDLVVRLFWFCGQKWLVPTDMQEGDGSRLVQASIALENIPLPDAIKKSVAKNSELADDPMFLAHAETYIKKMVSLLLYICSSEPDYNETKPQITKPSKTKDGWKFIPPKDPKIFKLGVNIGETVRSYNGSNNESSDRNSPRPHVRKAHWHGYWVGSGDKKKLEFKWLPPIPVGLRNSDKY